jgi:hypothetical protein
VAKGEVYRSGNNRVIIKDTGKQVDIYLTGKGERDHCHYWVDKSSGKSGVDHRGYCDWCNPELSGKSGSK